MKTFLIAVSLFITTQSFAAKCLITGTVKDGASCFSVSTRLDVNDVESCESLTKATKESRFFSILLEKQELVSVRYTFKDRPNRYKVKKEFILKKPDLYDGCR